MTDNELLAVMKNEIDHVISHNTHDAIKKSLKRLATRNAAASNSGTIGKLSRSQLGRAVDYFYGDSFSRHVLRVCMTAQNEMGWYGRN